MSNGFNEKGLNMAENNPAISVIIPMYNVEKYIAECLESLLAQTFQDFEVIVVDDCSTDFSRDVVHSFFQKFGDKLKLFKMKKNTGFPGIPRNVALEEARGQYVYFLDSDDLLTNTALEELYNVAENFNADVVHCDRYLFFKDDEGKDSAKIAIGFQNAELVAEPTLETFDLNERVTKFTQRKYSWWAWNKLFRRQFLLDSEIKFPEVNVFEDLVFVFKCLVVAKNYVRAPFAGYYYRYNNASMSHKSRNAVDSSITLFKVVNSLDEFMLNEKFFRDNPEYRYEMLNFFIQMRLNVIAKKFFVANNYEPAELFESFRENIFSVNPEDYVTLTAYLFVSSNILKLITLQQDKQIKSLQEQIGTLKDVLLKLTEPQN